MKKCADCKETKSLDNFYPKKGKQGGEGLYLSYCKICSTRQERKRSVGRRKSLINLMGGKCISCGFDDWRALQVDHINGGGHQEFVSVGPSTVYQKAKRGDSDYQLLCANCNWIKRYENRESFSRYS